MNKSINYYFYQNDNFRAFTFSNKKKAIHPVNTRNDTGFVSFKRNNKKGRRKLTGSKPVKWAFALSFVFQLSPFPHYIANHHITTFDENGFLDVDDQIKYRRSIPAEWFNRDWFERILAFMNLANDLTFDKEFSFKIGREIITLDLETVEFLSDYGYEEA